ncbi:MAG TPA: cytochrome c3 family protein [Syntrophorhabdus sp.]|nr:cytochrome c3 family protein [Syntrophorhabdus sp.]HQI95257.1 cytochrome c3 family protein [Syntrophorhabdus sp.]
MKKGIVLLFTLTVFLFGIFSITGLVFADKQPPDSIVIKNEGAKLPPVNFSHKSHVEKNKLECVKCHHKDTNPKEPERCGKCHLISEVKDNAPIAKDAYHKQCQTCHKDSSAKGVKAPTACNECHKK